MEPMKVSEENLSWGASALLPLTNLCIIDSKHRNDDRFMGWGTEETRTRKQETKNKLTEN